MTQPPAPPPPPPGYPPQQPAGQAPNNYLVWSILVTLFCCLPFGIVAIVKSSQVNGLWAQGRYAEAQASADSAKKWVIWSAVIGVVVGIIYGILMAVGATEHEHQCGACRDVLSPIRDHGDPPTVGAAESGCATGGGRVHDVDVRRHLGG